MFERELQNLGLTDKEARVYLASLELGPDTVQNISKKSGINRATTYTQIETLKEKGLISEFEKGKKTFYMAESPDRLMSLLNTMEQRLDYKKMEAERLLPNLKRLYGGHGEKPKVRFLEGVEGAKTLTDDFLSVRDKQLESIANLDKLFELFPKHEDEYSKKRIAKGIKSKFIYTRREGPLKGATDLAKLREAKFVHPEQFPVTADITIYDNKVAFATYKDKPIGIIVESQEIADTMRMIFYRLWKNIS